MVELRTEGDDGSISITYNLLMREAVVWDLNAEVNEDGKCTRVVERVATA